MRAFEDGRKEHYQRPLPEVRIEECGALSPQEAETKLRQMIETQGDVLGKVCRVIVVLRKVCRVLMLYGNVCKVKVFLRKVRRNWARGLGMDHNITVLVLMHNYSRPCKGE